jgi:hypothetical protein
MLIYRWPNLFSRYRDDKFETSRGSYSYNDHITTFLPSTSKQRADCIRSGARSLEVEDGPKAGHCPVAQVLVTGTPVAVDTMLGPQSSDDLPWLYHQLPLQANLVVLACL